MMLFTYMTSPTLIKVPAAYLKAHYSGPSLLFTFYTTPLQSRVFRYKYKYTALLHSVHLLCGPSYGAALSVAPRPSVRPSCASDFLEIRKMYKLVI